MIHETSVQLRSQDLGEKENKSAVCIAPASFFATHIKYPIFYLKDRKGKERKKEKKEKIFCNEETTEGPRNNIICPNRLL